MNMPLRSTWIFLLSKGIAVFHPQRILYIFLAEYFACTSFQIVERADVVKTTCVILMIMGEQDCIKVGNSLSEHLLSEVRTCIYKDPHAAVVHQSAGPQSFVSRVTASAHFTAAADHRHSL